MAHEFSDDLLNIHQEIKLLSEIKDIQDELNMLATVMGSQYAVLEDFYQNIEDEIRTEGSRRSMEPVLKDLKRRHQEQMRLIQTYRSDIVKMHEQAGNILFSLTNLLDLKQKHSNALEARFAREQAIIAGKQGSCAIPHRSLLFELRTSTDINHS